MRLCATLIPTVALTVLAVVAPGTAAAEEVPEPAPGPYAVQDGVDAAGIAHVSGRAGQRLAPVAPRRAPYEAVVAVSVGGLNRSFRVFVPPRLTGPAPTLALQIRLRAPGPRRGGRCGGGRLPGQGLVRSAPPGAGHAHPRDARPGPALPGAAVEPAARDEHPVRPADQRRLRSGGRRARVTALAVNLPRVGHGWPHTSGSRYDATDHLASFLLRRHR